MGAPSLVLRHVSRTLTSNYDNIDASILHPACSCPSFKPSHAKFGHHRVAGVREVPCIQKRPMLAGCCSSRLVKSELRTRAESTATYLQSSAASSSWTTLRCHVRPRKTSNRRQTVKSTSNHCLYLQAELQYDARHCHADLQETQ